METVLEVAMARRLLSLTLFLLLPALASFSQNFVAAVDSSRGPATLQVTELPLSFEENTGQSAPDIKFVARGPGYSVLLAPREAILELRNKAASATAFERAHKPVTERTVLRMQLSGANPEATISGVDQLPGKDNYFPGSDPATWRSNISTFARVRYGDVYPGIDLVYHGNQRRLEYDWLVAAHANPRAIRIHFEGAKSLTVDRAGDLIVDLGNSRLLQHRPVISQSSHGFSHSVNGRFVLLGANDVGFSLGKYDHSLPLVIDPVLQYSTFLGGSDYDTIQAITLDAPGNIYIAGNTTSLDFPGRPTSIPHDALYVAKLNPAGTHLLQTSFIDVGSGFGTAPARIAVDPSGAIYVSGITDFAGYPAVNAFQSLINGGSIFLSSDSGANWAPSGIGIRDTTLQQVAIDPTNPQVMYAWGPNVYARELYKTIDGGAHWAIITPPVTNVTFEGITAFALSAANPSILYASSIETGFFKSLDGGATWTKSAGPGCCSAALLVADPGNANTVYAADFTNVYQSTDGGSTWTLLTSIGSPPNIVQQLALAPNNPAVLYVAVGIASCCTSSDTGRVLRMAPGIQSFSTVFSGTSVNGIAINPNDYNSGLVATDSGLFSFGNQPAPALTGNITAVSFAPSSSSTIFAGILFRGVVKSMDGGATFQPAGLSTRDVASFTTDATRIIATTRNFSFDQFVTKLSPDGGAIEYSTFIGGNSVEYAPNMEVGSDGTIFLAGTTTSVDFPTTQNAQEPTPHTPLSCSPDSGSPADFCANVYLMAIRADGSSPLFSTFFGGSANSFLRGLTQDASGNLFIAGETSASDLPVTPAAFQAHCNGTTCDDGFVSKFSSEGKLLLSTFLGGKRADSPAAIATDASGAVYVTGTSVSPDFPIVNPFQQLCAPSSDTDCPAGFVTKLSPDLSHIIYSTDLANAGPLKIAVDNAGRAHIAGGTASPNFPTVNAIQSTAAGDCGDHGGPDPCTAGFVTVFQPEGSTVVFSTYLSGTRAENFLFDMALGTDASTFVVGYTYAANFPVTSDALQPQIKSVPDEPDGFLSRISLNSPDSDFSVQFAQSSGSVQRGSSIALQLTATPGTAGFFSNISFSCSNLPAGTACSFSPTQVMPGTSPAQVTVTVNLPAATSASIPASLMQGSRRLPVYVFIAGTLGLILSVFLLTPRRRLACLAFAILFSCFALWGCSGIQAPIPTSNQVNQVNVTVTATSGTIQHSANIMLTVQ